MLPTKRESDFTSFTDSSIISTTISGNDSGPNTTG
jgi:hypothetical protein